jgi:manganese/iron transport system permease protein/iron/zinc/copper transport system permease protein
LQAVGCILAIGLIVAPAAIVRPFISTPEALFPLSGLVGALGSALGLVVYVYYDLPGAGASIAATLASLFILSVLLRTLLKKRSVA